MLFNASRASWSFKPFSSTIFAPVSVLAISVVSTSSMSQLVLFEFAFTSAMTSFRKSSAASVSSVTAVPLWTAVLNAAAAPSMVFESVSLEIVPPSAALAISTIFFVTITAAASNFAAASWRVVSVESFSVNGLNSKISTSSDSPSAVATSAAVNPAADAIVVRGVITFDVAGAFNTTSASRVFPVDSSFAPVVMTTTCAPSGISPTTSRL